MSLSTKSLIISIMLSYLSSLYKSTSIFNMLEIGSPSLLVTITDVLYFSKYFLVSLLNDKLFISICVYPSVRRFGIGRCFNSSYTLNSLSSLFLLLLNVNTYSVPYNVQLLLSQALDNNIFGSLIIFSLSAAANLSKSDFSIICFLYK